MQKGAAVVLLEEVFIRKGTTVRVRRELTQMFPKYECYIAVGSHVDVRNDENDRTLSKGEEGSRYLTYPTQKCDMTQ
jgi:hypothetical protein